jgi:hypothetical protein
MRHYQFLTLDLFVKKISEEELMNNRRISLMPYHKVPKNVYFWNIRGVVQYIMMSQTNFNSLIYEFCMILNDSLIRIDKA